MSIETTLPYGWLRTLSPDIKMLDERPLWGYPPPFPWDEYGKALKLVLDAPGLAKIEASDVRWRLPEEFLIQMGNDAVWQSFSVAPLKGNVHLIFAKEHLKTLLQAITQDKIEEEWLKEWDTEWQEEFYRFISLQAIHAFQEVRYDPSLAPSLQSAASLPGTPCPVIDLNIHFQDKIVPGRLIISPEMRESLKQKYIPNTLSFPPGLSEALTATVHVVIGNTTLSQKEWGQAKPGDFLLLDACTLVPGENKGRVVLTVNGNPIFRAKLKDNGLKLLEYPLLQEVQIPMAKQPEDEFDEAFESEDEALSEEEIEPFEEEEGVEEEALEPSGEEIEEEKPEPEKGGMVGKELLEKKEEHRTLVKPEDIPLTISVEIARIQMSMEQLRTLTPGNLLDLNITPDNGVDLVVNGHCIGKGELLKLGETIGVRILDKA